MLKSLLRRLERQIQTADRLAVLIVATSILLVAIACFGAWHVSQTQAQSEELLSLHVASIQAAVEMELHLQELRHGLDRYRWSPQVGESPVFPHRELQAIRSRQTMIDHWLQQANQMTDSPKADEILQDLERGLALLYRQIEALEADGRSEAARQDLATAAGEVLEQQVLIPSRNYLQLEEALLEESRHNAATQSRRLIMTLLGIGFFSALAALSSGYGLARAISRSLIQVRIPMLDVAGKLSEVAGAVVVSTKLDLHDLGPALERVSQEVKSVVSQLHERHQEILHAEQLATAGQLAAGIAHEIRNPLMAMKMLVQAARRPESPDLDQHDLRIMDDEIRRLEVLLDEFLDFARPRTLKKELVDIRPLCESTIDFLQRQADDRNVVLECEVPVEPILVNIDPPRIRQVLLNLLLNGIQVTPPEGSVKLAIDQLRIGDQLVCRLQITDEGPGLGDITHERLFEPFFSTKETGLGLGLPVSQSIVKLHGGEIQIDLKRPGGAEFIVLLPIPVAEAVSLNQAPPLPVEAAPPWER